MLLEIVAANTVYDKPVAVSTAVGEGLGEREVSPGPSVVFFFFFHRMRFISC